MDNIYQAIKAFFKAIINLFVAVIDLFAGLLNGIAFLFEKLKPKAAERLHSLGTEKEGAAAKESRAVKENGVAMVTEIREQLAARVKTKEQYYYEHACMQESGSGLYMIVLSILTFALFGSTMLYSQGTKLSTRVLAAVIMAALCVAACVMIISIRKKVFRSRVARQILEAEFSGLLKDQEVQQTVEAPETEKTEASEPEAPEKEKILSISERAREQA